jgi:tRNA(Ile)-lysidine synthase
MLVEAVRQFFVKHRIPPGRIVAAVSGGTDSTALLLALCELREDGFEILAAHVHHHLRGRESDADEAFVRELCASKNVRLDVADGTLDDERIRDMGIEGAAREIRYQHLQSIREQTGADYVATAHQKNDQAETVLMRLLTGTGIAGLRGIHPVREDGFIRPLLDVERSEIEAFLREQNITPRHDRSNDDPRFLRNRVRAFLRELNAADALAAAADQARAQWPILERAIDEAERACAEVLEHETHFQRWPDDAWLRQALLHRHIHRLDRQARDVSARDLQRLANEVATLKRVSVTKSLELQRRGDMVILRHVRPPARDFELPLAPGRPAFIEDLGTSVHVERTRGRGQRFQVPEEGRFVVRNRRRGDRFQPLGLMQPKKLKDFLIDRKIPADVRDHLPLLLWNDEIVWVAGVEISERFKVCDLPGVAYEVWLEGS